MKSSRRAVRLALACVVLAASSARAQNLCIPDHLTLPAEPFPVFWSGDAPAATDDRFCANGVDNRPWRGAARVAADPTTALMFTRYREGTSDYLLVAGHGFYAATSTAAQKARITLWLCTSQSSCDIYSVFASEGGGVARRHCVGVAADESCTTDATDFVGVFDLEEVNGGADDGGCATCGAGGCPTGAYRRWQMRMRIPFATASGRSMRMHLSQDLGASGGTGLASTLLHPAATTLATLTGWATVSAAGPCRQGVAMMEHAVRIAHPSRPLDCTAPVCDHVIGVDSTGYTNPLVATAQNVDVATLAPSAVHADFRLAAWGSVDTAGDYRWFGAGAYGWQSVCDADGTGAAAVAVGSTFDISCNWATTNADYCTYSPCPSDPTNCGSKCTVQGGVCVPNGCSGERRRPHQCMYVELSSAGAGTPLVFSPASTYRNMDFVRASTFERLATLSVGRPVDRDVYLVVHTENMPGPNERIPATVQRAMTTDGVAQIDAYVRDVRLSGEQAFEEYTRRGVPTYVVHVFRDTGRRETSGGREEIILESQPSFGYFVSHDGPITGFRHDIEGAVRLGPDLYRIRTGPDGAANVRTVIEALGDGQPPREARGPVPQPPCMEEGCCNITDRCDPNCESMDPDCRTPRCNLTDDCDVGCAGDPDCGLACNTTAACDGACPGDPDCPACNTTAGCDRGCEGDPDCDTPEAPVDDTDEDGDDLCLWAGAGGALLLLIVAWVVVRRRRS